MKILVSLGFIAVLISGYVYFHLDREPVPVPTSAVTETPDDEFPPDVPETGPGVQIAQYTNSTHAFAFKYRLKPYGYSIFENSPLQNSEMGSLFGINILRSADYNERESAIAQNMPYDGPPAISVIVFEASGVSDVASWLEEHERVTNCQAGSVLATVVADQDASSCLWDGLYSGVTVAVLHADKMYVLTGVRDEGETTDGYSYKKDFEDVVASFVLSDK